MIDFQVNKGLKTEELWDLTSQILGELSKRDGVQYRVKATEKSGAEKLERLI